jgi:hypothetical protein
VLDRNRGEVYRESKRELEAAGYLIHTRHVEKLVGRSKATICRRAKALNIGRHLRGPGGERGPLRFRKEDIDALSEELKCWDHLSWREPDPGQWGRLAPVLAKHHGKRTGRKPSHTEDEADVVLELRHGGASYGQIQVKTGLKRGQIRRIVAKENRG